MTASDSKQPERKVLSVSELTQRIKRAVETAVGRVWVEGELSNVTVAASGHAYFTIKDAKSQISGVMFAGSRRLVTFPLADGIKVRAFGEISVFEPRGSYQIIVRKLEQTGKGDLQAQFEELKRRLHAEGLFAPERKQALPMLPRQVGVVTSPTGAAIRDIINVVTRRFPNLHLVLAPVKVQGNDSPRQIAAAIDCFNTRGGPDVLIVGRGGGSLEDLWSFNEEVVARAIARSRIPIISAVGHEIDYTISDFTADLRAPTPSAAAELVVGRKDAFEERLAALQQTMERAVAHRMVGLRGRLDTASASYVFKEPAHVVRQFRQRIDQAGLRMEHALSGRCERARAAVDDRSGRLVRALEQGTVQVRHRLEGYGRALEHGADVAVRGSRQRVNALERQLAALNPLAVLERGYGVTRGPDGGILTSVEELAPGDTITTRLHSGTLEATVDTVTNDSEGASS